MVRRLIVALCGAALAATSIVLVPRVASADTGSCSVLGTAHFTPGLKASPHAVKYTFNGQFKGCHGTYPNVKSATLTAAGSGKNLSCTGGQSTGTASVKWNTGQTSSLAFTTTGTGNMVTVTGHITQGLFLGDKVSASLTFNADPNKCATTGVTTAPFTGTGAIGE